MLASRLCRLMIQPALRLNKRSFIWTCKVTDQNPKEPPNFFKDKNLVYVGGYGCIGYACCQYLGKQGLKNMVIVDVHSNSAILKEYKALDKQCKVSFIRLDLSEGQKAIQKAVDNIEEIMGTVDVLINGSGVIKERNPTLALQTNLVGLVQFTLATNKLMSCSQRGKGGVVVNIASVLGLEPGPFIVVYSAAQHGIIGFTRALADEYYYKHTKVAHLAICPGFTETYMLTDLKNTFDYAKPISDKLNDMKLQSPYKLAELMMPIITKAENGSIWIIDEEKVNKISMEKYWSNKLDIFSRKQRTKIRKEEQINQTKSHVCK